MIQYIVTNELKSGTNRLLYADYSARARGLVFASNDRGYAECTGFIPMGSDEAFALWSTVGTLRVMVNDSSSGTMYDGRIEDIALTGDGVTITALGFSRALSDAPYVALWSSTRVAEWYSATDAELTNAGPERFQLDTNNRLFIAPQKNGAYANAGANFVIGGLVFDLPSGASRNANAGGIQFDYETNTPTSWVTQLQTFNSAGTVIATPWTLNSTAALATGSIYLNALAGNPTRFIFELFFNAASAVYAGETGAAYLKITNVRITTGRAHAVDTTWSTPAGPVTGFQVVTPASMTGIYLGQRLHIRQGAAANAESVIVSALTVTTFSATFVKSQAAGVTIQALQIYADDIAADLASVIDALNPGHLSDEAALIGSPGLDLLNEVYEDALPSDILDYLAAIGDTAGATWEWGVKASQLLYFRVQNSAAIERVWYVDVSTLDMQRTLDALTNSVYAVYSDASGRTLRTAASSDTGSIARYGVTRRQAIDVNTSSATQAGLQQSAALSDGREPKPRAGIVITQIFDARGSRWPLWHVQAQDTVIIRNLSPALGSVVDRVRVFRLTRASYDCDTDTLTVEPELPRARLDALLAQFGAGVRGQITIPRVKLPVGLH